MDLVAQLPTNESADDSDAHAEIPINSEALELLWSGVSESTSDRIDQALDSAHVFHKITEKEFGFSPSLAQSARFVWIDPRDRSAARAILRKALEDGEGLERQPHEELQNDNARVNPFNLGRRVFNRGPDAEDNRQNEDELYESDEDAGVVADDIVEDFDPDDATTQVWSGSDQETAEYLKMSLEGVGIGSVLRKNGDQFQIFVLPASEIRAKEIVREVVEGTPPQ